MENNQVN